MITECNVTDSASRCNTTCPNWLICKIRWDTAKEGY